MVSLSLLHILARWPALGGTVMVGRLPFRLLMVLPSWPVIGWLRSEALDLLAGAGVGLWGLLSFVSAVWVRRAMS